MSRLARATRARRGITLLEVMVAIGVLSLVASLIYGAFDGMSKTRNSIESTSERYHQGRTALGRMSRELQTAYLSLHRPFQNPGLQVSQTLFAGTNSGSYDRVDFTSFSHRRLGFDTHESDQNELSYFVSPDPATGAQDLVRREATQIDMDPAHGGVVQVMAQDVISFNLEYLDHLTGDWVEAWDSSQPEQFERLPKYVRIELVLNHPSGGTPYRFVTKVPIAMQAPILFGVPQQ
ncbi:MAG: type II secretion system protein GspJ [Polyangiaceae bacterium]